MKENSQYVYRSTCFDEWGTSMEENQKEEEEAEQKEKRRLKGSGKDRTDTIAKKREEKAAATVFLGEYKKNQCKHLTARNCKKCACWCHCICVNPRRRKIYMQSMFAFNKHSLFLCHCVARCLFFFLIHEYSLLYVTVLPYRHLKSSL